MNKIIKKSFKVACAAFGVVFLFSCSDRVESVDTVTNESVFVNQDEAIEIAKRFIQNNGTDAAATRAVSGGKLKVVLTDEKTATRTGGTTHPSYYVINLDSTAYVVVSGSKVTSPVLGFSFDGPFVTENIPDGAQYMFNEFASQIKVANVKIKPSAETENMREAYLEPSPTRAEAIVGPLLGNIKWNQSPYYNAYCPSNTPVGCVATATSQIMRYYKYPKRGTGSHSYRSSYGTLSFNYDYDINWDNMPGPVLRQRNDDIARFCYGVAVSIDMGFSPYGSGTWQQYVPRALKTYYKYPSAVQSAERSDYTYEQWVALVKRELDARRPVQYCGGGSGGAHSFVCDGYTQNNYFHFNWGWGGMSDGYFLLYALNPGSLGTGGGAGGYNNNQSIVVNFAPPGGVEPNPDPEPNPNPTPEPDPVDEGGYPKAWGKQCQTTFIKNVQIGSVGNETGSSGTGYAYYNKDLIALAPGATYELTLTPGFTGTVYTEYWTAWIDFNGNKKFDSNEMIAYGLSMGGAKLTRRFTVPTRATRHKVRMRVCMSWGTYAKSEGSFTSGEVEDYDIQVSDDINPTPTPNPDPKPDPDPKPNPNPEPNPTPSGYCQTGVTSPSTANIRFVELGGIQNYSSYTSGGYSDFTNKATTAYSGYSLRYTLSPNGKSGYNYWRMWIDFDNDKEFDSSEMVLQKVAYGTIYGRINLPRGLSKGYHRVRISMKQGGYADACDRFEVGEVEDYLIYVKY